MITNITALTKVAAGLASAYLGLERITDAFYDAPNTPQANKTSALVSAIDGVLFLYCANCARRSIQTGVPMDLVGTVGNIISLAVAAYRTVPPMPR